MILNDDNPTTIDTDIPNAKYYFLAYKYKIGNFISFGNSFTIAKTPECSIRLFEKTLKEQLKVDSITIVNFKELSKEDYYLLRGDIDKVDN
jgi:hypothetical protein